MRIFLNNSKEKAVLAKIVKDHFIIKGWLVRESVSGKYEFDVKQGNLRFLLVCCDGREREFLPAFEIVSRLDNHARDLKRLTHTAAIFVVPTQFPDISPTAACDRGIYLITVDNLEAITDLAKYQSEPPSDPSKTEKSLLRENVAYCLAASEFFLTQNDTNRALEWNELALGDGSLFSPAYKRLFDLLTRVGNSERAALIAKAALQLRPDNLEFMKVMRELAIGRGDQEDTATWDMKITKAAVVVSKSKPDDLESILTRQKPASRPITNIAATDNMTRFLRLFRKPKSK
jgi:hypothetical protein